MYLYEGHEFDSAEIMPWIFSIIAFRGVPCKLIQLKAGPGNSKVQEEFAAGVEMGRIAPCIAVVATTLLTAYVGPLYTKAGEVSCSPAIIAKFKLKKLTFGTRVTLKGIGLVSKILIVRVAGVTMDAIGINLQR